MGAKKCISKFLGVLNSFGGKFRCCEKNCDGFFAALINKNKTGGLGWWFGVGGKAMFFW